MTEAEFSRDMDELFSPGWSGLRKPKACIIGLGLIGGSWAGALHQAGWQVFAVDRERTSLNEAVRRGWIESGWADLPQFMDVDLIVLALPLQALESGLEQLTGRIPRGAIVTDVGSIKTEICRKAIVDFGQGSKDYKFVGGHPMTGSERSGFGVANPDLFRGYPYVLTPTEATSRGAVQKLCELLHSFGANVVFRDPADHDAEVAMVSHIPHMLAVALTLATDDASKEGASSMALAGRSFRDITRIADSSPEMWKEIMVRNSAAILEGLSHWEKRMGELRDYLEQADGDSIAEAFRSAHALRDGNLTQG